MLLLMIALIFAQFKVGCNNPRIRKEIRELSKQEWSTVKRVVNQLKKNGVFRRFAEIHHSFFSRFHNNVYFMPWHRQFIYNFETEMRKIDANVTLPYWNWAKDADKLKWNFDKTEIFSDYYLGSVGPDRCVKGGPFDYNIVNYPFRHCISRRLRRDILPSGGGVIANIVATPNGVEYFGKLLENGPHALFHMHLGGDMGVSYSNNDFAFYVHHTFSDYALSQYQYVHNMWTAESFTPWWKNAPLPILNNKIVDVITMKYNCVKYEGSFPNRFKKKIVKSNIIYKREEESEKSRNVTIGSGDIDQKIELEIAEMPSIEINEMEEEPMATETEFESEIDLVDSIEKIEVDIDLDVFQGLHLIYSSDQKSEAKWDSAVKYIGDYFDNSSFTVINNNVTDEDYKKLGMVPEHARYIESQLNYLKMYTGNITEQPVFDVKTNKSVIPKLEQEIAVKEVSNGNLITFQYVFGIVLLNIFT